MQLTNLTKIDRLAISFTEDLDSVRDWLDLNFSYLGVCKTEAKGGMLGFKHSLVFSYADTPVARLGYGGTSQKNRAYLDVSGVGCGLVFDWQSMDSSIAQLPEPSIRRVDIAADYYAREVTHEMVFNAYTNGEFKKTDGGRPPKMRQILPGSSDEGRTLYVGNRSSDTFFRGYEKGKKEFQGWLDSLQKKGFTDELANHTHHQNNEDLPLGDWYRCELELKSKTKDFPNDIISNRDQYFAGAYPFLARVLSSAEPKSIISQQKIAMVDLEVALQHIRKQYGSTLFTALHAMGGDIHALLDRIVGDHHNERLLDVGVMLPEQI